MTPVYSSCNFSSGFLVCFLSTVLSTLSDVLLLPGVESILVVLTFHFRAGPKYGYKNGQEGTSLPVRVENGQLLILIILLIHPNRLESKATAKAVNLAFGNDCSRHKKEDCLAFFLVPKTELSTHNVCVPVPFAKIYTIAPYKTLMHLYYPPSSSAMPFPHHPSLSSNPIPNASSL